MPRVLCAGQWWRRLARPPLLALPPSLLPRPFSLTPPMPRKKNPNRRAAAILRRYLNSFSDVSEADKALLTRLAGMQAEIEIVEERLSPANRGSLKEDEIRQLNDIRIKLSREIQSLQEKLGITRAQRQGEIDTAAEVKKFIREAREFVAQKGIAILCPNCGDLPRLHLGIILYHFAGVTPWKFTARCPNCLGEIELSGGPEEVAISPGVRSDALRPSRSADRK